VLKMLYKLIKLCTVLYSFKIGFLLIKLNQLNSPHHMTSNFLCLKK
jgi:hypothetical protein